MRPIFATIAVLLMAAAPAQPSAPPAAKADASSGASEALTEAYRRFCLERFPDRHAFSAAIAEEKLKPATPAQARSVLGPGAGQAWVVPAPGGDVLLALQEGSEPGCAVASDFAGSDANRAVFELAVQIFVGAHDLGTLQRAPLQQRSTPSGDRLTLQALQITYGPTSHEQFLDGTIVHSDGRTQTRLVRVKLSK